MNSEQYASLVMPETAILELTEYCNFNCVHCYETHQRESLLDIDDYITVLHDLKRLGCFKIILTGGEPFIRKELLFDVAKIAKKENFHLTIITNLSLCDSADVQRIYDIGVDQVCVSLYGFTDETYAAMCQVAVSAELIRERIVHMKRLGLNVKLLCTLTSENICDLSSIEKWCATQDIQVSYNYIIYGRENDTKENLTYALNKNFILQILNLRKNEFIKNYSNKNEKRGMCSAGRKKICIAADGTLFPCATWRIKVGSVFDGIEKSWVTPSRELMWIRQLNYYDFECSSCSNSLYCTFCPGVNYSENTNPFIPAKSLCKSAKILKEFLLER